MEDRRCKLGLQGRRDLVLLVEQGSTLRQAAACLSVAPATAHRWWHRWRAATDAERASLACLRTRSSRPLSCPWALSREAEKVILDARSKTNYGPLQLQFLTGRHRSTIHKVLVRHGVSRRRRTERPQTSRRYEWAEAGALLHIDAFELPRFDRPVTREHLVDRRAMTTRQELQLQRPGLGPLIAAAGLRALGPAAP
jgi:transposase